MYSIIDHHPRDYAEFLHHKTQSDRGVGFDPSYLPEWLFPFQRDLVDWSLKRGRSAIFADCGLGKTAMELVWAKNVSERTGRPVLILTPLAVTGQTLREADKFRVEATRSHQGEIESSVIVSNYERLHRFDPGDFAGVVCDESSILKSFDGATKRSITDFMRHVPYRLLGTATAAPNDYVELGTSSEALGYLGYMDMLTRFFTNRRHNAHAYHGKYRLRHDEWRFKGHAEEAFWRWVSSWARALRRPSDLGFSDEGFDLPAPIVNEHVVVARTLHPGMLFDLPAHGMREEREERRRTITERCEKAAALVSDTGQPAVIWCHLNDEGNLLERLVPDSRQVSGSDSDESKEETFRAFSDGEIRVLVTKPVIGAWGLNWQHCAHVVYFPSHSYEQYYQAVRRCWRFGQNRRVHVDIVTTEGGIEIQRNLQRKSVQADQMFAALVDHMNDALSINRADSFDRNVEVPSWLTS